MHFPAQLLLLLQWDNKTSGTILSYLAWDVLFFGRAKHVFTLTGLKRRQSCEVSEVSWKKVRWLSCLTIKSKASVFCCCRLLLPMCCRTTSVCQPTTMSSSCFDDLFWLLSAWPETWRLSYSLTHTLNSETCCCESILCGQDACQAGVGKLRPGGLIRPDRFLTQPTKVKEFIFVVNES